MKLMLLDRGREVTASQLCAVQTPEACRDLPGFDPALNLFAGARDGTSYRMAAMFNSGLALEWLREILGLTWDDNYPEAATTAPPLGAADPRLPGGRGPRPGRLRDRRLPGTVDHGDIIARLEAGGFAV